MSRALPVALSLLAGACAPPEYETGPEVFSAPTEHIGDSWLFSATRINRIDLELDADAVEILRSERGFSYPRNTVRSAATIDAEFIGDVGVRLRGGLGSFRAFDKKPKFELDLNEYSGERFYGLESLSLNNMITDCSGMREALAYHAYHLLDVPSSRTGFAQLFINSQDYGLYLVLESQDDRWLRRNFLDGSGNLYDGKYVYSGYWPTMVDFAVGRDDWFDLEEGTDVGFTDITRISQAVERADQQGYIDDDFATLVDWDRLASLLRVEQWLGDDDGLHEGPNNYRVYFEPGRPMVVHRWDTDGSFPVSVKEDSASAVSFDVSNWEQGDGSSLSRSCLADSACRQRWSEQQSAVAAALSDGRLLALGEQLHALVEEGVLGDPRRYCGEDEDTVSAEAILAYLAAGELAVGSD